MSIVTEDRVGLLLVGPFVDFYPTGRSGLHLGALVGLAWLGVDFGDHGGSVGGGLLLRGGYSWRLATGCSLGADLGAGGGWTGGTFSTGSSREVTGSLSVMITVLLE